MAPIPPNVRSAPAEPWRSSIILGRPPPWRSFRPVVRIACVASAIVAALHYLALALGLPSVFLRGRALKGPLDREGLRRLFAADGVWGVAAGLWLVTGLLRAFGGLEKGSAFYMASRLFWLKLALFLVVVALEVWPMLTLIRWRRAIGAGRTPDTSAARTLFHLNHVELALVVVIVFVASFMARGFGLR